MHAYRQLCLRYVTLHIHFFLFLYIHKDMHKRIILFCVCKDAQKKRKKYAYKTYTLFALSPAFSFPPCRLRRQGSPLGKVPSGKPPRPLGRPFLFLPYLFSRSIHIFLPYFIPFRPSAFHSAARSLPGGHSTPVDSFADIFFFLLLPRSGWREWERLAAEEKKMNGWRAVG